MLYISSHFISLCPKHLSFLSKFQRVIGFGAPLVVVPGNFPIGCVPSLLTLFVNNNISAYDEYQCLKELNKVAEFQNEYVQQAINTLQEENPTTKIVYADYYNAFKWLLRNAPHLGNYNCRLNLQTECALHI